MTNKKLASFPVLKTERLTLRQLISSDDKEIFVLRSDENVNKYLGRKRSESIDDARSFIEAINASIQKADSFYWAITLNGVDKLVGTICLFDLSDNAKAEIGYELLPGFGGKGIMQEAAAEVIRFAFQQLNLHSIEAYSHPQNHSSTRLLEKLNFKKFDADNTQLMLFRLTPDK